MIFHTVALATDPHQTQRCLAVDFRILGHGIFLVRPVRIGVLLVSFLFQLQVVP